jgi:predicted permease
MTDSLLNTYAPLLFWIGLGFAILRFLPDSLPRIMGRGLYWVGIPLEVFVLARQTDFNHDVGLAPIITIVTLVVSTVVAWIVLQGLKRRSPLTSTEGLPASVLGSPDFSGSGGAEPADLPVVGVLETTTTRADTILASHPPEPTWSDRARQGSFLISAVIGNTGFVGLAVAPSLISENYLSWIVIYSVLNNLTGTYTIGVGIASFFGRSHSKRFGWQQIRDILTVPSLWGFTTGFLSRSISLPETIESGLHASIWVVIPAALVLMGMRLSQLRGWKSLKWAIAPTILKALVIPASVGFALCFTSLPADARLAMVLMSGMPTAFAGLILAEEYELDSELIASSILLTTVLLLAAIPLWLVLFGSHTGQIIPT